MDPQASPPVDRAYFLPVRKHELVPVLARELEPAVQPRFLQFNRMLEAVVHAELEAHEERLKDLYAPFDPDDDCKPLVDPAQAGRESIADQFFREFDVILDRANYCRVPHDQVVAALRGVSDWGLRLQLNFAIFDRLRIYSRGDQMAVRSKRKWRQLYRERQYPVSTYQRLVIAVKLKPAPGLGAHIDTESLYLKLFKDIPKLDLEMLLPGTRARMRPADRLKIGLPLATGAFSVGKVLASAAIGFYPWLMAAGGAIGYGMRSFAGYQRTKEKYMLNLTESLYYQNLDNNAGVIYRVIDHAEEEVCKQALLAWFMLGQAGESGCTAEELAHRVEKFVETRLALKVHFHVQHGLDSLRRMRLLGAATRRLHGLDLETAIARLGEDWERMAPGQPPSGAAAGAGPTRAETPGLGSTAVSGAGPSDTGRLSGTASTQRNP